MTPVDEVNSSYRMPFKYIKAIPYGQNMDGYEKEPWPVDAWREWYYELAELRWNQ